MLEEGYVLIFPMLAHRFQVGLNPSKDVTRTTTLSATKSWKIQYHSKRQRLNVIYLCVCVYKKTSGH